MISISPLKKEQLQGLRAYLNYIWKMLYGDFLPADTRETLSIRWLVPELGNFEREDSSFQLCVAKNEIGEIIGLFLVSKTDYDTIKINRLYVSPAYRRQGVGKMFLEESTANFPYIRKIEVEVEEENYQGRLFYLKQGFKDRKSREEKIEGKSKRIMVMEKKPQK